MPNKAGSENLQTPGTFLYLYPASAISFSTTTNLGNADAFSCGENHPQLQECLRVFDNSSVILESDPGA